MNNTTLIWTFCFILIVHICSCNDLGSLIEGVTPFEDFQFNGEKIDTSSDKVVLEKDEDGKIIVSYFGEGSLLVKKSTGIPSKAAQELIGILKNALGSRYRLMATLKRGGRLITLRDERRLNTILESQKQRVDVHSKDSSIDLSKASLVETTGDLSVLEPVGYPGITVTVSADGIIVNSTNDDSEIRIIITKGLNQRQTEKLKENFYSLVAEKTSYVTGLPKSLIELILTGRDAAVYRLSQLLSPNERIIIGNQIVNMDESKKLKVSSETILTPETLPKVKIMRKKGDTLRVESEDGESIYVEYSKGVEPRIIRRLVDNLHRAITLRMGLISWSNKLIGSIPPQLESALEELKTKIQRRTIYVDNSLVDLKKATVVKTTDEYVLYRIKGGALLRVYYDGTVSTEGTETLALEITPGISETQAANVLAKMNQIFSTAVTFSTKSGETVLNDESNRKILQKLLRGIKPKEKITIDGEVVLFKNATFSKKESDYNEYTLDGYDYVILTKYTEGDVKVVGKGRSITISRSTGLSLEFLNKLIRGINSVMPRKRWFYTFGQKGGKNYFREQKLQAIIDEIPQMIHRQTVSIDDTEVNINKAIIMDVSDEATIFSPEIDSKVKITKFSNGNIQAMTTGSEVIAVKVSSGITSMDAETLIKNIQSIVGDRFKVSAKRPENIWCSSGGIRKLLSWLLNKIYPSASVEIGKNYLKDSRNNFARTTDGSKYKGLIFSKNHGLGKNITAFNTGQFKVALSTGLTEEMTRDLIDYLISLLENNEDVIKMVTRSLPDNKVQKIKDKIQKMIQHNIINVDTETVTLQNAVKITKKSDYTSFSPSNKRDMTVKHYTDGSIEVDSPTGHNISVSVTSGITQDQAEQLYQNVLSAFTDKFSEIIRLPVGFINVVYNLKKYLMKSYFYSAALPKEFVSVNGDEIDLNNLIQINDDEGSIVKRTQELQNMTITEYPDGRLEILSKHGGNIDVIRTTGLNDEQINRILKAVEYKIGIKNKLFRYSSDKLWMPPEKSESLDEVLKNLMLSENIYIDGFQVDMGSLKKIQSQDDVCSLLETDDYPKLTIKKCDDGQISIDYDKPRAVTLQILPGISQEQSKYIYKCLVKTIQTRSSSIKILSNFPDIFFKLLADGRLSSLEKLLLVLIPKEEINMDGKRMKLESHEENSDEEYKMIESDDFPGLQAVRYKNGTLEVKSWNGGRLDVTMNTGLSPQLVTNMMNKLTAETSQRLTPVIQFMDTISKSNPSTILHILQSMAKSHDSKLNLNMILDAVEQGIREWIHSLNTDDVLMESLASTAIQMEEIRINDQLIHIEEAAVIESKDNHVVYTLEKLENIKITKYDSGRVIVEDLHEDPIEIKLSPGIPKKLLDSFIKHFQRLMKKLDSDYTFTKDIKEKLMSYSERLYETFTNGIIKRRNILIDDQLIELTKDIEIENTEASRSYKKDDVLVTIDALEGTRIETISTSKLELDIGSGVQFEPIVGNILNNSAVLLRDLFQSYKHSDTMVSLMTKMRKMVGNMIKSLERTIEIYIDGKPINLSSVKLIESTKDYRILMFQDIEGLKLKSYFDGRLLIELPDKERTLEVYVSQGLSPSDLGRLADNAEATFTRINPIELFADIFDLLPKNFFILAQNMDRVLSVMNLIKF